MRTNEKKYSNSKIIDFFYLYTN